MNRILYVGLLDGALLTVALGTLIAASFAYDKKIFLRTFPPEVRQAVGEVSRATIVRRRWLIVPLLLALFGFPVHAAYALDHELSFATGFASAYLAFSVFNLFDLLVIDWLIGVVIDPRFARMPGTESGPSYQTFGFHLRLFARGCVIGLALAGLASLTAIGLRAIGDLRW